MSTTSSNYIRESDFEIGSVGLAEYLGHDPDAKDSLEAKFRDTLAANENPPSPAVKAALTEHMDISDRNTRAAIMYMNEADQVSVLASLTAKLYEKITTKVDDIDYGEIPMSKGDITKLSSYEKLRECIDLLKNILKEFKQDTGPIDELSAAMSNISTRKELFGRAFKYNCEMPQIVYNNIVLSIVNGVAYMIATCIEFIKTPNKDSFEVVLDKVAYSKSKSNMLYGNLKKFNAMCKNGNFDKVMEEVIQAHIRSKSVREGAINEGIGGTILGLAGKYIASHPIITITALSIAGLVFLITTVIPLLRDMVFLFYYMRVRVSDFFDIQADLLQMNAFRLQNDESIAPEDKDRTVAKQLKYVEVFRKIANKISYTAKKAEVEATKEITSDSKKMKINDVSNDLPDSVSALF